MKTRYPVEIDFRVDKSNIIATMFDDKETDRIRLNIRSDSTIQKEQLLDICKITIEAFYNQRQRCG